jgi:hypothetical protein
MRILIALLAVGVGLTLAFTGYRLARIIIPIWGFISGMSIGGAIISDMSSTPFLGTFLGIITGLVFGLALALIAYLYYSAAIVVMAGLFGYWMGSSVLYFIGLDPGFLTAFSGIIVGAAFGWAALMINAPKYLLVLVTAVAGAVTTVGGVLLLFNAVPLDFFSYTASRLAISNSFIWALLTLALGAAGAVIQARSSNSFNFTKWDSSGHSPMPAH